VDGMRAVLWHWAGGGLRLPQAKAPSMVGRRVILFGPEPWHWGAGLSCYGVGGGSRKWAVALLGVLITGKNLRSVPRIQTYIAWLLGSGLLMSGRMSSCDSGET
jgi:hypothetical protein